MWTFFYAPHHEHYYDLLPVCTPETSNLRPRSLWENCNKFGGTPGRLTSQTDSIRYLGNGPTSALDGPKVRPCRTFGRTPIGRSTEVPLLEINSEFLVHTDGCSSTYCVPSLFSKLEFSPLPGCEAPDILCCPEFLSFLNIQIFRQPRRKAPNIKYLIWWHGFIGAETYLSARSFDTDFQLTNFEYIFLELSISEFETDWTIHDHQEPTRLSKSPKMAQVYSLQGTLCSRELSSLFIQALTYGSSMWEAQASVLSYRYVH